VPNFRPLTKEQVDELTRRRGTSVVDLTAQKDWINQATAEARGWGAIEVLAGDNVRAIKRRTTIAGKELGRTIKWHRKSSPTELIFQALSADQVVHRNRHVGHQEAPQALPQRRRSRKLS
jgi:hypothetical protein